MRNTFKYSAAVLLFAFWQLSAAAQGATAKTSTTDYTYWGLTTFFIFILAFGFVVLFRMRDIGKENEQEAFSFRKWWTALDARFFTKAVAVEKEEDILLDHDYDGIKELDNALPPWWKYGFYITVVVGVIYLLRFHVFHSGPTPEQEYYTEMKIAAAQVEEYRKKSNDNVDEKTVTMGDAASIERGKKIFSTNCFACHGANGEGGVGPNLTDDYWLHGGTINDVFRTIKYGVPDKGMQAWEKTYSPSQIKDLSSFIKTLRGTNPPNGKAPQGDLVKEETAAKDSTTKK